MASLIKFKPLQKRLETLYQLGTHHDVDDFIITDRQVANDLHTGRDCDEKLLLRQDASGHNLDVALFLDSELVARLADDNPLRKLHQGNLIDFCVALEGISHFLCVLFNCRRERKISHLELELQAEVDKFVLVAGMFGHQCAGSIPRQLHQWLFDNISFDQNLEEEEHERYRAANRYAGKYCYALENRYFKRRQPNQRSLLNELRGFYRLPLQDKLRRIEQTA